MIIFWLFLGLILAYYSSKKIDAIDCFDKAILIDPTHLGSWYKKGITIFGLL